MNNRPPPPPATPPTTLTSAHARDHFPPLHNLNALIYAPTLENVSASRIQHFFVRIVFDQPLKVQQLKESNPLLSTLTKAIGMMREGLSFKEGAQQFSRKEMFETTAKFLASLPDDNDGLKSFPVRFRSARSLLSAPMIHYYPAECLGDDAAESKNNLGARRLLMLSSSFIVTALFSLRSSLANSEPSVILSHYGFLKFSLRFLAKSLEGWQKVDDAKVADELMVQYSECFAACMRASLEKNILLEETGKQTLHKMRNTMVQLVGRAKAESLLSGVEHEVRERVGSTSRPASPSPQEAQQSAKEKAFVDKLMSSLSNTNERLAHEIIMDPNYRVPGSSAGEEDEEEEEEDHSQKVSTDDDEILNDPVMKQAKMIKEKMRRVFWDRLLTSLTPPKQASEADLRVGEMAQCRYGPEGAFYSAKIVKVMTSSMGANYFDIEWTEDHIIEEKVPSTRFRYSSDPVIYTPLLNLIEEVKSKLLEIAPKQQKYREMIERNMDTQLIQKALENSAYDGKAMYALIQYITEQIIYYQAPVRNSKSRKFISNFMEKFTSSKSTTESIACLPEFLEWVFDRIDETKNDIANSHIEMLRPHLKKCGVDYEREKFRSRIVNGQLKIDNTEWWIEETVGWLKANGHENVTAACARKDADSYHKLMSFAFVVLLRRDVRADLPQYAAMEKGLPETLLFDSKKLAEARDLMDSVALTCTIMTLFRQVLARNRVTLMSDQVVRTQSEIQVLLKSQGVNLADIEAHVLKSAKSFCPSLPKEEEVSLASLVRNSAKPDNAIFKLFSKRMDSLVFDSLMKNRSAVVHGTEDLWMEEMIKASAFGVGFDSLPEKRVTKMLKSLFLVFSHTMKVHHEWYYAACMAKVN